MYRQECDDPRVNAAMKHDGNPVARRLPAKLVKASARYSLGGRIETYG